MIKDFPATMESVPAIIQASIIDLQTRKVNEKLLNEYRLVIEELATKLIENANSDGILTLESYKRFGTHYLRLCCPGSPVILTGTDEKDFGGIIIEEFRDYLKQSYSSGRNYITFVPSSGSRLPLYCGVLLSTIPVYLLLQAVLPPESLLYLKDSIAYPIACLFISLIQMLSAPVLFFSIAATCISLQRTFEHDGRLYRLFGKYFATTLIALGVGIAGWLVYSHLGVIPDNSHLQDVSADIMGSGFADVISQFVTPNIVLPFTITNPIPLLLLAILLGVASGSVFGMEGKTLCHLVDTMDKLFERMLAIAYMLLPFFLFFSLLSGLLLDGLNYLVTLIHCLILYVPLFLVMLLVYVVQLAINGINLPEFWKKYKPLIIENLKIGSNIDALPYNKRMLSRLNRGNGSMIQKSLLLGTMVNMDGNCLMLSGFTFIFASSCGITFNLTSIIACIFIIMLISLGIPNQPGSLILGLGFLSGYLGISAEVYTPIIITEALFGWLCSFVNSIGDVTTVLTQLKSTSSNSANSPV